MFQDENLKQHLETSSVVKSQSLIIAEWNMNAADNILAAGNYRHRPTDPVTSKYKTIPHTYDPSDEGNFYTGATDADIVIDGGYTDLNEPTTFQSLKEKEKSLYSLEECFGRFRPRSGINKLRYFENHFSHHSNMEMAKRPRFYMAHKNDQFKYWTSYRTESGIERGIANHPKNGNFYIDDAAPFVVYKEKIPTNRLVVKMQSGVGSVDLGPFNNSSGSFSDPFYGYSNQSTPVSWKIQILDNGNWSDAISFNQNSKRADGSPIIGSDGYVEIGYGVIVPEQYRDVFKHAGELASETLIPSGMSHGEAYLIKDNDLDLGSYYMWNGIDYDVFVPTYGWKIEDESVASSTSLIKELLNTNTYLDPGATVIKYRDFQYISGIRIVVDTMNKPDAIFDLIEMSPRLSADISDITSDFSITKNASDLGISGMPVGQLLASTGSLTLYDFDQAFNKNNPQSLINKNSHNNIQFKFYEVIKDVAGYDYFVPLKTLYSESFPEIDSASRTVKIDMRDMFFYLESLTSPQLLIQNASVSYAVSLLLDAIGFSNYSFKRNFDEKEPTIPYFFVGPDKTVAQALNDIAVSTQTAMFFDEYNDLIMMSKDYIMPTTYDRNTDITLSAKDSSGKLANIASISSKDNKVYNNGKITYVNRYIQKTYGSIRQASLLDVDKTWVYKPALLWEVSGSQNTKSVNDEVGNQSSYVLSAIPLNSSLTSALPQVKNHVVINNTMDLGEGVYWITRNNGYFYANGEVIKYDAVQYNIPQLLNQDGTAKDNNVWISSAQEYENYFSKLSFNGKIYPTGLVRIYSEPNYEVVSGITRLKDGAVAKHGRGQFGTAIVDHSAGLNSYWSDSKNMRGCEMNSSYLFNDANIPSTTTGPAGVNNVLAAKTTVNGIIKNFLSTSYVSETDLNILKSTQTGTVQSSALVMNGASFSTTQTPKPLDFVSYVYKPLSQKYTHFGTRMRIIGKMENNANRGQTPIGTTTYYVANGSSPDSSTNIGGASGGLAVMLNPQTNNGYYFEIAALTENNINSYSGSDNIYNVIFYKVKQKTGTTEAIPIRLWAGLTQILVDDGKFTGQSRVVGETSTTVYDLSVEYEDLVKSTRRFYLYINNNLVATVDDVDPLPVYNNMALFVRGSARCMFENIYAITNNYSKNTAYVLDTPVNSVFQNEEINVNDSFRKYAMNGIIQSTYLSGISPSDTPSHKMYFEEFGTIMREASYFNIKYDKAYPALYAKISPTFNKLKGYTVSGFLAGAYGAEFLVFNATDTALSLDESSGNYLRIQGITFTQSSSHDLTVDEFFNKTGELSDPEMSGSSLVYSPLKAQQDYKDIKNSRTVYGSKEFNLNAPYIQTADDANAMMKWVISKIMKPRRSVGVKVFAIPTIQLGDIVELDYVNNEGSPNSFNEISSSSRFVVYSIQYEKSKDGPSMTLFLSEVL